MGILEAAMHVHLIGVGGIGLSAIARVLHGWGYQVSGSDLRPSTLTRALAREGIRVFEGHRAQNVSGADLVVVSSAVPADNPELVEARNRGLPVLKREQFLGDLTADKMTIAVAGTHGKTTTSAMIAWILLQAGLEPTFIVGGVLQNLGTNAQAGIGPHFVIEADEYDRAFLGLRPSLAAVTTLEHDHPDCYPTFEEMKDAFGEFVGRLIPGGLLVVCGDDAGARQLSKLPGIGTSRVQTYGLDDRWDWWAVGGQLGNHAAFEVRYRGRQMGTCALQVPGRHNVLNALAALATSVDIGVDFGLAVGALARFRGTERRFEVKGQADGIIVVDDYAHHPTEIRVTLEAARIKFPGRRIWGVFQPHTYSRTLALMDDFAEAFGGADRVLVTDIYAAREGNTLGVSGADVVAQMHHPDAQYVDTLDAAVSVLLDQVQPGDVVITLGAGDGFLIGERVLKKLNNQAGEK